MIKPDQPSSAANFFAFRLRPHEDLKDAIVDFAIKHRIQAGAIVTCVGSLEQISLRFANRSDAFLKTGHFEILSLVGTFSQDSAHLHLSVANEHGDVVGGHLMKNNLVYTTAELVVVSLSDLAFERETDHQYGYRELAVKQILK